jgi:hypothetical protein
MKFALRVFVSLCLCVVAFSAFAQDGATRANWPHCGGTQFTWRYSAVRIKMMNWNQSYVF